MWKIRRVPHGKYYCGEVPCWQKNGHTGGEPIFILKQICRIYYGQMKSSDDRVAELKLSHVGD